MMELLKAVGLIVLVIVGLVFLIGACWSAGGSDLGGYEP